MLKNKNAIITGSTSGIGFGIAQALAAQGVNIMLNGFGDRAKIEAMRAELGQAHDVKAVYSSADMTRPDEIKTMVDDAIDAFGTVDILINNAGIQHVAMVDEFPIDKWDDIIAINLSSSFHTIRAALPDMKKNGWGRIINIASIHGIAASPFKSAYVAAKHGVVGLTKTVALEVAEQNITVNAICPGYVRTPLVENQIADTAKVRGISPDQVIRDVMMDRQASKKFVEINEVAAFVVFLCGDGAASITGVALPQDGGWSAL